MSNVGKEGEKWSVTYEQIDSDVNKSQTELFDAVIVANGHFECINKP